MLGAWGDVGGLGVVGSNLSLILREGVCVVSCAGRYVRVSINV